MTVADLLRDAYARVHQGVHAVLDDIDPAHLTYRPDEAANTVAWLVWHLARVEDDHIAGVAGTEQLWTAQGWAGRFALPFDPGATGYGQSPDEVGSVRVSSPALLSGYHDAVHEMSTRYLASLDASDLLRVVDEDWDPPVTLGVRLVSVLADGLAHVGQAAYVRGMAERAD